MLLLILFLLDIGIRTGVSAGGIWAVLGIIQPLILLRRLGKSARLRLVVLPFDAPRRGGSKTLRTINNLQGGTAASVSCSPLYFVSKGDCLCVVLGTGLDGCLPLE